MNSKKFTLVANDFVKAVGLLVLYNVLSTLYPVLNEHRFPTGDEWSAIGFESLKIFIAYIIKNFLSDSSGKILGNAK